MYEPEFLLLCQNADDDNVVYGDDGAYDATEEVFSCSVILPFIEL